MKKFIPFLITIITLNVYSQNSKKELGEVTIEELKERSYPRDTSAAAVVMFENGKTFFEFTQGEGFRSVTEVEVKIKVYKKEGYDYANKTIPYYVAGSSNESVTFSKAITYNLVNGSIEKSKLKSEGEFTEKKNKFWNLKKITMPNVKEGSIIEYKYIIRSPYLTNLPEWTFQREIPVAYSEYTTRIPEYFFYNVYIKGFLKISETKSKINKSITLTERTINGKSRAYDRRTEEIRFFENVATYKNENIPGLKSEAYVNNIENYVSAIQHELKGVQMPNSPYESFSTDWESVVKKIYEDVDFGAQLKKDNYFENDLKIVLTGLNTRDEKIQVILDFVKSRMTWDNFHSYSCDAGVSKAYQNKIGNSAEINLMLTSMLRYAGINASPVLLSTRSNGIALFPSLTAFNYVIAAVEIEDDLILLDATSKYAQPNVLPLRDLNWFGRIIRKEGSSTQVDLSPKMISKRNTNLMGTMNAVGEISGKIKDTNFDYNGFNFRETNNKLSEESYLEKLENNFNNIEVSDYTIENKTDSSKPIVEQFSFKYNDGAEVIGDKIYFSPLLFFGNSINPFIQDARQFPIDFSYPNQDKCLVIVNLPEGYAVETLPAPIAIVYSDNLLSYKFNIFSNGKQVQVSSVFDINTSILDATEYQELKRFFDEMIKKQTEKVVLKKI